MTDVPVPSIRFSAIVAWVVISALAMVACSAPDTGRHVSTVERTGPASDAPVATFPTNHPQVATGAPSPTSEPEADDPDRIVIDDIGVDASIVDVGLADDGSMETPDYHQNEAGWYDEGPEPGSPGPAVVVAHVDGPDGDDVFARLAELDPDDEIVVTDDSDIDHTFVVTHTATSDKDTLPYDEIWADTPDPVLRLITCHGDYVSGEYEDNLIVYAVEGP